jgi:hypothetical protein
MNSKKTRKPLSDALASQFVYGEDESKAERSVQAPEFDVPEGSVLLDSSSAGDSSSPLEEQSEQEQPAELETSNPPPKQEIKSEEPIVEKKENKESSLMDKLQVQPKEATKRFTVDLSESMHRKLSILSAKTGRTKADIVRLLLEDALSEVDE